MYIHVNVRAGLRKEIFESKSADHFIISIREKAEHNAANMRVLELIAAHFNVPQNHVHIVNGHHSPSKLIEIREK